MGRRLGRIAMGFAALIAVAAAQEEDPSKAVIAPLVAELPSPSFKFVPSGAAMAVTTSSQKAQRHVTAGIGLIHGGWDFEAYRHFCAAVKEDPDCLMAYWGIALALAQPDHEFAAQQLTARARMIELAEAGVGTELERGYAFCLNALFTEGPKVASGSFQRLADRYPNEVQARLFAAILGRGGYDLSGRANPEQVASEQAILGLLERSPEDPMLLHAYLTIRAEARDLKEAVALARRLVRLEPDFPPYQHVLGHYEWRVGNQALAGLAFQRAIDGYERYMEATGVSFHDCPGWLKSRLYLVTALHGKDAETEALAVARDLASLPVDEDRLFSPGGTLAMWEGKTLPARLLLAQDRKDAAARAKAELPDANMVKAMKTRSLAIVFYQALAIYLEARVAIEAGELDRARELLEALSQTGLHLSRAGETASGQNATSSWMRAVTALEVHAAELRGLLAMAGPPSGRGSAFNWYRSAADKDARTTLMMPPMILYPMATRLGEYHRSRLGQDEDALARALAAFQEALALRPNDLRTLRALEASLLAAKDPGRAALVTKQIQAVLDQE